MKYLKSIQDFFVNEQLFKGAVDQFNKLMGISIEKTGGEEPNLFGAESPSGMGQARVAVQKVSPDKYDSFGSSIGITDKSENAPLQQPASGPIGNIVNSAYANINTPTRAIPGTERGNLGCAAATSIIFYRATGYAVAGSGAITLGTSSMWNYLDAESKKSGSSWKKITNWKTESEPGDIILTARASKPGHVGVVVDGGNIISNSSGGFQGDQKGQIEMNYNLNSWDSVASRNPTQTASFRYVGPYKAKWDSQEAPLA